MRKHSKKFLFFLLAIAILGSLIYIYSALKTAKAYTFFNPLKLAESIPSLKITIDYSKKSVDKIGGKIKNQINAAENYVPETMDGLKDNTFGFVKKNMDSGLNAIGRTIGVDEKIINQNQETNQRTENNQNCK